MAGPKQLSARNVAIQTLNFFQRPKKTKHNYASSILNKLLPQTTEPQRATDLVFGTLRNRSAIDMAISKLADCPAERIPKKILNLLRVAAYELIYCPQTPPHAIVNEAVENTKTIAGKKQTAFVNAVLRQITRHIKSRQISLEKHDPQKMLPQTIESGCEFDTTLLGDPRKKPADYFSKAFSLPKWLIEGWLDEFGLEKTKQICFASNRKPSIYLRPNRLKTTTENLAEILSRQNVDFEISDDQSMINIKSPRAIDRLDGFNEGLFTVQDITAAQLVKAMEPSQNFKFLDLCAAPGTKTTQLAELTNDKADIIATDIDPDRLEKVRENARRLGLKSITSIKYKEFKQSQAKIGPFDCILLDVPCSNTGVLAKRLEVRYRINPKAIEGLTKTQIELLEFTARIIKQNGKICYSTCSIQNCENDSLIKNFLSQNPQLKLQYEQLTLPSAQKPDRDGGYIAILTNSPSP
ncbi:MAG: 16S rRNA (cytosine(967)-C(5))-methyltransferase RsmB [Planctomycetota bacterium]|jgi:16S rRNA (cytosine967-C5)-methyltransferase